MIPDLCLIVPTHINCMTNETYVMIELGDGIYENPSSGVWRVVALLMWQRLRWDCTVDG